MRLPPTAGALSRADERALFLSFQSGDRRAGDRLTRQFYPLALAAVGRALKMAVRDREDMTGEAYAALARAMQAYNPDNRACFATYARRCIDLTLREYVINTDPMFPGRRSKIERRFYFKMKKLKAELGRDPTGDDVAERFDLPAPTACDLAYLFACRTVYTKTAPDCSEADSASGYF